MEISDLHVPAALKPSPPPTEPLIPIERRLSGPQNRCCRSGRCGGKENVLMVPGIEPRFLACSVHNLVPLVSAQSHLVPMCMVRYKSELWLGGVFIAQ
jgi:hypothetical protein